MLRRTLMLAALAAALAAPAGAVGTGTIHVTGQFKLVQTPAPACRKTPGQPWLLHCKARGVTLDYSGSLQGSSTSTFNQTLDCKKGLSFGGGTETFTGSVGGAKSGTLTWEVHFATAIDCAKDTLQSFSATDVIVGGAGALVGLQGSLYRIGDNTYSGEFTQKGA